MIYKIIVAEAKIKVYAEKSARNPKRRPRGTQIDGGYRDWHKVTEYI
jgi:hypothetical protein